MKRRSTRCGKIALLTLCVAAATVAQDAAASSSLPIYPGATKPARRLGRTFPMCGHKVGIVSYNSAADAKAIAKWYQNRVPGAIVVDLSRTDSSTIDTEMEVFTPDASQAVVIHRLTMTSSNFQAAAKSLGTDKTGIGVETFDPPLGAEYLSLQKRAHGGDAAARRTLSAKCPKEQ